MKKRFISILGCLTITFALVSLATPPTYALNTQLATPNIGPTGTFNLFGSRPLRPKQFSLGFVTNYTEDPLEFRNFATGRQVRAIVDYLISTDFIAEVGLHKLITVGVDIPIHGVRHMVLTNPAANDSYFSIGDIGVYSKIAALHPDDFPIGLAFMPFVIAPSGSLKHFIGDRSADLGVRLIIDKEFGPAYIGANIGYKGRVKKDIITATGSTARLEVNDEFIYGVGGAVDVVKDRMQVMAEFRGSTVIEDFAQNENQSPMEAAEGFKFSFLDKHLNLQVGAGAGLNGGYGASKYRVFGGLNATLPMPKKTAVAEHRIETIILQGVNFFTASHRLTPDSKKVLDENIAELKKYPDVRFVVIGHTDSRGNDDYNQKLSEQRARAVADYFISQGLPADCISSEGRGESQPIVPNDSPEHMEKNRRVELMIIHGETV